jgi:predicted nucleic acid-binding protein
VILVDTSVWIDYFNGAQTAEAALLDDVLTRPEGVLVGDLVVLELLQGLRSARQARLLERTMLSLPTADLLNMTIARQAAANYRTLRTAGVTPRKTVDLIIATYCIAHGHELLHRDRDFTPMARHLGLRTLSPSLH